MNQLSLSPIRRDTSVRSIQVCFLPSHPNTRTSACQRADHPSSGSVRKFTGASFFAEIPARFSRSQGTSSTTLRMYLKPDSSLQ
ncbi:hypothetical protein Hanom_Chr12g01156101 [Helianthus anomalus]